MKKILIVILLGLFLAGCIASETQSFTDPDYKDAKFTKLIVNLNSLPVMSRMEAGKVIMARLKEAGYDAIPLTDILPPTRTFSLDEAKELVAASGYGFLLAISVQGDTASTSLAGIYSYSSGGASVNGNNVRGYSNTTTTPIIASKGQTAIKFVIFDVTKGTTAWDGTVITKASGTAFVGNVPSIAHSAVGSIIDRLKEEGHF